MTRGIWKSGLWYKKVRNTVTKYRHFKCLCVSLQKGFHSQRNWSLLEWVCSSQHENILFCGKLKGYSLVLNPSDYFGLLRNVPQCFFPKDFCKFPAGEVTLLFLDDSYRPSVTDWNQAFARLLHISLDCLIQRAISPWAVCIFALNCP